MIRRHRLVALFLIATLLVGAVGCSSASDKPPAEKTGITYDTYMQIDINDTFDDVITLLDQAHVAYDVNDAKDQILIGKPDATPFTNINFEDGKVWTKGHNKLHQATVDGLTLAKYNSITEGMHYDDVKNIIGADGSLTKATLLAGLNSYEEDYTWNENNGPGNIKISFKNDAVVRKWQGGLK